MNFNPRDHARTRAWRQNERTLKNHGLQRRSVSPFALGVELANRVPNIITMFTEFRATDSCVFSLSTMTISWLKIDSKISKCSQIVHNLLYPKEKNIFKKLMKWSFRLWTSFFTNYDQHAAPLPNRVLCMWHYFSQRWRKPAWRVSAIATPLRVAV